MENTNTTLLINEKEKENAKALTQSFVKADVKSRAYINALGAEVYLQYLNDNGIDIKDAYHMHNIRKVLEEFDLSDIMLSNIHIDVRVVYNENTIFIPKSHFEYNLTPDIYVILQVAPDYTNMEFLGFFEPKMLNKNNTNGEYYFIEKEKLSSPVDLKNFIESYEGNTSRGVSEQDAENAEYLIISMFDNNVSEADKKQLLDYLKSSAELRNRFTEFENFEMLAYQAVSIIESENESNTSEEDTFDGTESDEMFGLFDDTELSNTVDSELLAEEVSGTIDENLELDESEGGNLIEDILKDTALMGAEIAGAAVASAALSGVAEGAEIADTLLDVVDTAAETAEKVMDTISAETVDMPVTDLEELTTDIDSLPVLGSNEEILDTLFDENEEPSKTIENPEMTATEPVMDMLFTDDMPEMDTTETDLAEIETTDDYSEKASDDTEFSANDDYNDLVFESGDSEDMDIPMASSAATDIKPDVADINAISPVTHSPISEATELFSLESIQLGDIQPLDVSQDLIEPMELDGLNALDDTLISTDISEQSVNLEDIDDSLVANIDSTPYAPKLTPDSEPIQTELSSDDFVEEMPEEIVTDIKQDEVSSDDFVEEMPEEIITDIKQDELSSRDFVEEMPEEVITDIKQDELSSKDFVEEMPEEVITDIKQDELSSDDFVEEMPEEVVTDIKQDELSSDDFVEEMPKEIVADIEQDILSSDDFVQDVSELSAQMSQVTDSMELPDGINFDESLAIGDLDNIEKLDDSAALSEFKNTEFEALADISLDSAAELTAKELAASTADMLPDIEDFSEVNSGIADVEAIAGNIMQSAETEEVNRIKDFDEFVTESSPLEGVDSIPNIVEQPQPAAEIQNFSDIENIEADLSQDNLGSSEIADISADPTDEAQIGVLYSSNQSNELNNSIDSELGADAYKPKKKGINMMPMFVILAAVVLAGAVVGFIVKNKNSIDTEALIQTSTGDLLANPEGDNTDVLANEIEPAIPTEMTDVTPSASPAVTKEEKQEVIKNAKEAIMQQREQTIAMSKNPLNASKTVTLKKVSWEVPDYLSYSENIKKYLQTAGKSIKLTLSSDLLLTNEYIYSNKVKVNLKLNKNGDIQEAKIGSSSGSTQVDNIVLQTVKETLNVVKPPQGEVPTPTYNLGLIIYL